VGILDRLKSLLRPQSQYGLAERRLDGQSEHALSDSLQTLVPRGRGFITLDEARRLFSSQDPRYAFGDADEAGRARLDAFASRTHCTIDIMPDGRVYFTRAA
jgi:hypothetical protein